MHSSGPPTRDPPVLTPTLVFLNRRLIHTARGGGKCENTLALHIRSTRGKWPLLGVEAEEYKHSQETGHYFDRYTEFGEEPALQCRRQSTRGLIVIEAWFRGY